MSVPTHPRSTDVSPRLLDPYPAPFTLVYFSPCFRRSVVGDGGFFLFPPYSSHCLPLLFPFSSPPCIPSSLHTVGEAGVWVPSSRDRTSRVGTGTTTLRSRHTSSRPSHGQYTVEVRPVALHPVRRPYTCSSVLHVSFPDLQANRVPTFTTVLVESGREGCRTSGVWGRKDLAGFSRTPAPNYDLWLPRSLWCTRSTEVG